MRKIFKYHGKNKNMLKYYGRRLAAFFVAAEFVFFGIGGTFGGKEQFNALAKTFPSKRVSQTDFSDGSKGSMAQFVAKLHCLDGSNVEAVQEDLGNKIITGNSKNVSISCKISPKWVGTIKKLYIDTNLYNGSTTKEFKIQLLKMSVGDRSFYPSITDGIWQLQKIDNVTPKRFCYQIINPDVYLVGSDLQTPIVNTEKGIDVFRHYTEATGGIFASSGETLEVVFSVSGMNPNDELITYDSPKDEQVEQKKEILTHLNSVSCRATKNTTLTGRKLGPIVKLTWPKVEGAAEYAVYRSQKPKSGFEEITRMKLSNNMGNYIDRKVQRGNTYYYKIRAFGVLDGEILAGNYSRVQKVLISSAIEKPTIKYMRKGNRLNIIFLKTEGSGYQTQYRYSDQKRWNNYSGLSGKIVKSRTVKLTSNKKLRRIGFYMRIRTYEKINGKKVYSKWSTSKVIKG